MNIAECAKRTGCRNNCYRPETCQQVIDSNGGPSGAAFGRVGNLMNCAAGSCQTSCASSGNPPTAGWWRFEEGGGSFTADASGNGHMGTLMNGAAWKPGIRGNSVALDGMSQFVMVNAGPILGGSTSFTIEAWVNWPGSQGLSSIYSEGGSADMLGLYLDNGMPAFTTFNGSSYTVKSASALPTFSWHHVAGVLQQGTGGALYVDGVLVSSNPVMPPPAPGVAETDIGRLGGAGTHFFSGAIDEVRAFTVPRTSQEVLDDYRNMGGP
jgi:hypothetical protein